MRILVVFAILVAIQSCQAFFGNYKSIDLSYVQDENARGWPPLTRFSQTQVYAGYSTADGFPDQWIEHYDFKQNEHLGTHMDAPSHFSRGAPSIEKLTLNQLSGNGIVIDITEHRDTNYVVTVDDIKKWEKENGRIPDHAVILLKTGKHEFYHDDPFKYYGWQSQEAADKKDLAKMTWPAMGGDAAAWLRDNRNVVGYGIDAIGIDAGNANPDLYAHRVICGANQFIIENVGDKIKELPARGFFLMTLPYKMKGGSGAPSRVVALIGASDDDLHGLTASAAEKIPSTLFVLICSILLKMFY